MTCNGLAGGEAKGVADAVLLPGEFAGVGGVVWADNCAKQKHTIQKTTNEVVVVVLIDFINTNSNHQTYLSPQSQGKRASDSLTGLSVVRSLTNYLG